MDLSVDRKSRPVLLEVMPLACMVMYVFSGQIKSTVFFAWLPFDLTILLGLLLSVGMIGGMVSGQLHRIDKAVRLLFPFAIILVAGIIAGIGASESSSKVFLLSTVTASLLIFPFFYVNGDRSVVVLLWALAILSILASLIIIGGSAEQVSGGRVTLDGSNTIGTARLLGAGLLVFTTMGLLSKTSRSWVKVLSGASTIILLVLLIDTGSRGPFLSVIVAILVTIGSTSFVSARERAWIWGIGATLLSLTLFFLIRSDDAGASRILGMVSNDGDTGARANFWMSAVETASTHPFGVGWDSYRFFFGPIAFDESMKVYPHNIVLEILVEAGWIAGAIFIFLLIRTYSRLRLVEKVSIRLPLTALFTYAMLNSFVSGDVNDNKLFWLMMAVVWAYKSVSSDNFLRKQNVQGNVT